MRATPFTARLLAATALGLTTSAAYATDYGIVVSDPNPAPMTTSGTIPGDKTGLLSTGGRLTLTNSGNILGGGLHGGSFSPDGGIVVSGYGIDFTADPGSYVVGQRFGLTTSYFYNVDTNDSEGRAIGSTVVNNGGNIIGENDDGVRLIGGGSVTNSGYIAGRIDGLADGVSAFAFAGQDTSALAGIATVTNLADGVIEGNRFGIILSGGGSVDNSGSISGTAGGVNIQAGAGKIGSVTNSGSISGGVRFAGQDSDTLDNSGSITSTIGSAVLGWEPLSVTNSVTGEIHGSTNGITSNGPSLTLDNAGTIRGDGSSAGYYDGNGGVIIAGGPASITNSGTISGATYGISTIYYTDPNNGQQSGLAIGSTIDNSGVISGDNDDAIHLIGGGTVTNSGQLLGLNASGIVMFAFGGQDLSQVTDLGTVDNLAGGLIQGNLAVFIGDGGTVNNAGTIIGDFRAVEIARWWDPGRDGVVNNSGTITGNIDFDSLDSASVTNSGTISNPTGDAILSNSPLSVENTDTGSITGSVSGIQSNGPSLYLDNAGTILGLGTSDNIDIGANGGVILSGGPASITNSGSISGAKFGIATVYFTNPDSSIIGLTTDTTINNSGSIIGQGNDGIRLEGGGTVTNSGYIAGRVRVGADGVSILAFDGQDLSGLSSAGIGTVNNLAGGVIEGHREGIIISDGGTVNNAGTINGGYRGAIVLEARDAGRIGTLTNSGTINGVVDFIQLASASLANSGAILAPAGVAVHGWAFDNNMGPLAVSNDATGTMIGGTSGILSEGASLSLTNAGTIRGNGHATSIFGPNGGVIVTGGPAAITNSGTISGWGNGISTAYFTNPDNSTVGRAIGTTVGNSGTIIGDNDDGIRLIGGGMVTNSGYISGRTSVGADGISMFAYNGQVRSDLTKIGSVTNLIGGTIDGVRLGVILSGGGSVDNAGVINGGTNGAVLIQGGLVFSSLETGSLANSGTINGNVRLLQLGGSTVTNSGTINGSSAGSAVLTDGPMTLSNAATGSITGAASGIFSTGSTLTVNNAGTIRGNGNGTDFNSPQGGILITGGPGTINNSGSISGQRFGISTFSLPNTFQGLAIGTTVTNSGSIIGDTDDGVRLIGGGSVTNSGYIAGRVGAGADGVSGFSYSDQDLTGLSVIGTVNNLSTGVIEGNRFGIIFSNGGNVTNAGTITGNSGSILLQAGGGGPDLPRNGNVANSGTLNGTVQFNNLANATVTNSGTISAPVGNGVYTTAPGGPLAVNNQAGGSIAGASNGIRSDGASLTLNNAGSIRGNGNEAFSANSAGGVVLQGGPGFITNSGSISGQQFGITTIYVSVDPSFLGRAIGSTVSNSGSIIGDNNDGVRLIGGGTVTNSGYIAGRVGPVADGVSGFAYSDQDLTTFSVIGSVNNLSTGVIEGNRFGIIFSNGGNVTNAGTITGNSGSILLQASEAGNDLPRNGTVTNSGSLNGTVQFNNLANASVTNSGTVASAAGVGIRTTGPSGSLSVNNQATGSITGATQGIFSEGTSLTLNNAGTIRGNGTSTLIRSAGAGVLVTGGPGAITNSGTISGARFGITTGNYTDPVTNAAPGRAIGTTVSNSGTIIGDNDDGIRLIGGGSVTNSGYISGRVTAGADGVSMFAYEDQDTTSLPQIGTVNNLLGGTIEGHRFGIIQSGGGTINNAGTINGGTNGAILIQTGFIGGKTGNITNSGTINGATSFYDLTSAALTNTGTMGGYVSFDTITNASLTNSGSISTPSGDAIQSNGRLTLTNNAGGAITGSASGIFDHGPALSVTNAGSIRGNGDVGIAADGGPASITNSGTIYGKNEAILTFGSAGYSTVSNSGSIRSDLGPAIQLLSGSVTNSGSISTTGGSGVSILNSGTGSTATVTNLVGGSISSVSLANGGVLTNSGVIGGSTPSTNVAVSFSSSMSGRQASLTTNAGSYVNGRIVIQDQASASIVINGRVYLGLGGYVEGDPNTPRSITSNSPTIMEVGTTGWIFEPVQLSDFADILTLRQRSAGSPVDGGGAFDTAQLTGTINSRSSLTLIPTLTHFESLQLTGGYWREYSNMTFGGTTITNGTLEIGDASLTSPVTVFQGGTLAGNTARVFGNVTLNSGGIINPGGSVNGTLLPRTTITINGNLLFNSGSAYMVNIAPNGTSDRLTVNGAVTINTGATLQVLAGIAVYPATTTSYTVLTATGGINGKFDKAVTDYAYYNASLNYQKNTGTITLNITPNGKPLPSAASATTFSTATAVDSLGTGSPIYLAVLNQSLTGARQAFTSLSGSAYARLDGLMASDVGHVELGFDSAKSEAPGLEWAGSSSLASRGLQSGQAMRRGPLSLMMVGGRYVSRLATDAIKADVDTRFLASAAGYRSGRFQALASVTSAWHDVSVGRTIAFPGFADRTSARYAAESRRVDLEGSYSLTRGKIAIAPYAGVSRLMMKSQAFIESGGVSTLSFGHDSRTIDQLRLGVRARATFKLGGVALSPHADVSFNRSWGDVEAARQAQFVTGNAGFDSIGTGLDSRLTDIDAGIDAKLGRVTLTGSYRGRLGNRWTDHSAMLRAALSF